MYSSLLCSFFFLSNIFFSLFQVPTLVDTLVKLFISQTLRLLKVTLLGYINWLFLLLSTSNLFHTRNNRICPVKKAVRGWKLEPSQDIRSFSGKKKTISYSQKTFDFNCITRLFRCLVRIKSPKLILIFDWSSEL